MKCTSIKCALVLLAITVGGLLYVEQNPLPVESSRESEGRVEQSKALAKLTQNPVANLISVPIQWNMAWARALTRTPTRARFHEKAVKLFLKFISHFSRQGGGIVLPSGLGYVGPCFDP
jgi:hypothetical protein